MKIFMKSEGTYTKEILFKLNTVEKSDKTIENLSPTIPEKLCEDIKQKEVLQKSIAKKEITYKGLILSETGIKTEKDCISWDEVEAIKYHGLVIAGYGATTIAFTGKDGKKKSFIVRPSSTEQYQEFLRYLIRYSEKASIDPGLIKAFEYSPKDAKTDRLLMTLFVSGILLLIFTSVFIHISITHLLPLW